MARTKQTARASSEEEEAPIEVPASEVEPVIRHGKGKTPLSSSIAESLLAASKESWSSMEEEEDFGGEDDEEAGFSGREEEFLKRESTTRIQRPGILLCLKGIRRKIKRALLMRRLMRRMRSSGEQKTWTGTFCVEVENTIP